MLGTATNPSGGRRRYLGRDPRANLSDAERQAAQGVLATLNQSSEFGSRLSGTAESAPVPSGSLHLQESKPAAFGVSRLIHGHGSDTFIGNVRSASPTAGASIGNDSVLGGSGPSSAFHPLPTPLLAAMAPQQFSPSSDTVKVASATATGIQSGHPPETTGAHIHNTYR